MLGKMLLAIRTSKSTASVERLWKEILRVAQTEQPLSGISHESISSSEGG